ncbi:MAG: 3'-5' exonuclease [Mycoplasmoidaceae bacterium]
MIYMDIETTGLDGIKHEVIEIYMLKEDESGNKIDEMHFYFKPSKPLEPIIIEKTKLTDIFLSDKPKFENHINDIVNFISNEILVGHNINAFDLRFLNDNLSKYKHKTLNNKTIDTMVIAREVDNVNRYAKGYRLIDLAKKYNIKIDESKLHGAKYDTTVTKELYKVLIKQ